MTISARTLPWDWYPGTIPENVDLDADAYLESTYSFRLFRSEAPLAMRMDRGAAAYMGTMFDLGPRGKVTIGEFAILNGCRIVCDAGITIGAYALLGWNVVLMDTYRVPRSPAGRRRELEHVSWRRRLDADVPARPIHIESNVWINFDVCVLPGVTIGEGSIIGVRSVVVEDVPPYSLVAGNPARVIRRLDPEESRHARQEA